MIEIDGTYGEGGGQIVRTSVSLAAITGKAVVIHGVRGRRSKPGLQPQHLMAVRAAGTICGASLKGDAAGSLSLTFSPGAPPQAGTYRFDIGTAGATTLVAQTILLPLALAEGDSEVTIIGGTHNPMAPCVDYLECVYLPALRAFGVEATLETVRYGFYPKGGGEIRLAVRGRARPKGVDLSDRGGAAPPLARIIVSNLPPDVSERGKAAMMEAVGREGKVELGARGSHGPGAAAFISQRWERGFAGFTGLGERGKRMEDVVAEAAEAWKAFAPENASVDEHLADQLVLPAVLSEGESRWRTPGVSEHLRSVAWLVSHFLDRKIELAEETGLCRVLGEGGA